MRSPDRIVTRPIARGPVDTTKTLRHILLSWRQDISIMSPKKLVYELDQKYSDVGLRADRMRGADAQLLLLLRPIAKELCFGMCLANLESIRLCENTANTDQNGGRMSEAIDKDMSVTRLVDLDGISVKMADNIDDKALLGMSTDTGLDDFNVSALMHQAHPYRDSNLFREATKHTVCILRVKAGCTRLKLKRTSQLIGARFWCYGQRTEKSQS